MFGVGWTEMLLVGVVALVVIGPKDLPVVMKQMGKFVGMIRRMGGEFQRELNKTTGLDQITDLRRSITEPLKQTAAEITREFNKISTDTNGKVEPTGIVAPKDPAVESVVAEIHERVGMTPAEPGPIAAPVMTGPKPVESPAPVEAIAPVETLPPKPVRKPRAKKAAAAPAQPPEVVAETPKPAKKPAAPRKRRTPKPTTDV